jgi:hypothetical protein
MPHVSAPLSLKLGETGMFTFGLKKKDIACCLLCYNEAEYVFSKCIRNSLLSLALMLYAITFLAFVLFAPSFLYVFIIGIVASVFGIFTKLFMHVELRCKKCRNSLLI